MQKFEYNGKKFHHECFTCAECKNPIGNNSFVPKENDRLICMPCYNDKFAQKCGKCSEVCANHFGLYLTTKKSIFIVNVKELMECP